MIVAVFSSLAVIAHLFGGTKDTASISPDENNPRLVLNWKQAMCAFQMLTVDLVIIIIVLFTISLTELIPFERALIQILSLVYFLWGLVWLLQLIWLKSDATTFLRLPHWVFWFAGSTLLYIGA